MRFPGKHFSKGVSTRFGIIIAEKCFPGKRIRDGLCGLSKSSFVEHAVCNVLLSSVQSSATRCYIWTILHFGKFMLPKRRFWTAEQRVAYAFLNEFSICGSPKLVLTPLKSTSKTHTQRFVRPSKIFVWGAYSYENFTFGHAETLQTSIIGSDVTLAT